MKYQKIYALGHRTHTHLFDGKVEATEKLDGSQFRWWCDGDGIWHVGTKRTELYPDKEGNINNKLFAPAVKHIWNVIQDAGKNDSTQLSMPGMYFWGETLCSPRHNTLKYDRVPYNHIAIWGAYDRKIHEWADYPTLVNWSEDWDIDIVSCIWDGLIKDPEKFCKTYLQLESTLGGPKVEGIVFKNYGHHIANYMGEGEDLPFIAGKYVSEQFKEKHGVKFKTSGNQLEEWMQSYRNENLWKKSVIRLREEGKLTDSPKDIGPILKEIHLDLEGERKEEIQNWLYKHYIKQIKRVATSGFPEWYKQRLAFGKEDIDATKEENDLPTGKSV